MIKKLFFWFLVSLMLSFQGRAQSFFEHDSLPNKNRSIGTTVAIATGWSGSIAALSAVWYKDSWGEGFQFFNDRDEWLQMDKFGHAYTGLHLTRNTFQLYQWSGLSRKKSLIYGSIVGFGYLASFEVLDGFSDDWGFSWWDIAANAFGVGWLTWQELVWQEERIKMKFSASPSPYAQYRPEALGKTFSERLLKDYNGQTYWFNFNPSYFLDENTKFPKWLALSAGYSVEEKLHGFDNIYVYDSFDQTIEFKARRQFLLSLDIDLTRIPVKKPWLKTAFNVLNHLKIPFPTIEYSKSGFRFHPIYF